MNSVTTVLTVTDRLDYLESQIESIENQSIDSNIVIHWNTDKEYTLDYPVFIYRNQQKKAPLYSRFFNSLSLTTPYVFICDDDILPGKKYLERCVDFSQKQNDSVCIVSYGMIFDKDETKYNAERIHTNLFLTKPKLVNMGGQGYFFKTDLLKHYSNIETYSSTNGEDIHLGFTCWKHNINTYVLDSDKKDKDTWQDLTLGTRGSDEHAQWRQNNFYPTRDNLIPKYKSLGWEFLSKNTI